MKTKFILFAILAVLFVPLISRSIPIPTATLTVIVNTQEDASFHFDLQTQMVGDNQQFDVQTQNLSGQISTWMFAVNDNAILNQEESGGFTVQSIDCTSDDPNVSFSYNSNSVSFVPQPWTTTSITCTFDNTKGKTPVLIVPGIAGTEMKRGSELLWLDLNKVALDPSDSFMNPLAFSNDLFPSDPLVYYDKVIRTESVPVYTFDYTDGLIHQFIGEDYIENQTLFTFPYDWRYGVTGVMLTGETNEDLLAQKIQDIMVQTGSSKVDVVAHSMGGLIVKKYVMDHQTDNYIRKAIFVGVPETGAPKSIKTLVQGDNMGINFWIFGLSDAEVKKISENMPGVYDLLPSVQYYNQAGSFVSLVDFVSNPNDPTEKDLDYQEYKDYLTQDKGLNLQAFNNAENLHTYAFDNFDLRTAGIDLYAIDGCKTATMVNFVQEDYEDIFGRIKTDYARVDLKIGDGTVPIQSSTNLPIDQSKKYYALTGEHSRLLSQDGSRQEIVNLISGSDLPVSSNLITQDVNECQLNGKAVIVYSPVDVSVTDQGGNVLGLAQGNVINSIPNADFEVWGDHKFIYLPTGEGQTYDINMQGTGSGTYTIKVDDIQNSQITGAEVFESLPVTSNLTGVVNLSSTLGQTTLTVKENKKSQTKTIYPTKILTAEEAENYLPPMTVITFPTSKDQCKKNGWKNFGDAFKNQGDCVSFVETQGKKKK